MTIKPPSADPPRPSPTDPQPADPAPFTAAERRLIRAEFRARGGQTDPLDDGIWLHRWAAGPHQGQPKLDRTAIRTLLERDLIEIVDPPDRSPSRASPAPAWTRCGAWRRTGGRCRPTRMPTGSRSWTPNGNPNRPGGGVDARPILSPLATFRATPPHRVTPCPGWPPCPVGPE